MATNILKCLFNTWLEREATSNALEANLIQLWRVQFVTEHKVMF